MKVLWFSNVVLGNTKSTGSGSWLFGMKNIISDSVKLYNVTQSNVDNVLYEKYEDLEEYIIPNYKLKNNIPSKENISKIKSIVDKINPDIVHVWGIELYWGLLFSRGYIKRSYIIEIQGLLSSCYHVYYGGLSPLEIMKCFSIKEIIKINTFLPFQKRKMIDHSKTEYEIITSSLNISTQSDWIRNQIKLKTKDNVKIFKTLRPIRKTFYNSEKWCKNKNRSSIIIYTSFSYLVPFKGFHVLIKALAFLKQKYNDIILNVGGVDIKTIVFYRQDGYMKYILSLIKKLGLSNNVNFIGRLDEHDICEELLNSDVFVNPSFVESYSAASAEALYLGVPSVLSYAGAMPNFSNEKEVALYYSPMDYVDLASKIDELICNNELSNILSNHSISVMKNLSDIGIIRKTQLSIYSKAIKDDRNNNN